MNALPLPPPVRLAAPQLLVQAVSDGRRLGLQLAHGFGTDLGSSLRAAGAVWFAPRRMWVVEHPAAPPAGEITRGGMQGAAPGDGLDEKQGDRGDRQAQLAAQVIRWLKDVLLRCAATSSFDEADAALKLRSAFAGSDREFFTQLLDLQVFPLESGGFAVSSLYDAPVLRGLRALRGRFHKHASAWEIRAPLQQLLDVLLEQAGVSSDYVFVHERSVVLEQLAAPPPSEVTIQVPALTPERGSGAANQDEDADEAGTGFLSVVLPEAQRCHIDSVELQASCAAAQLRDYQVAGVQHLASQEGACLGDDMGLGKTRQTVVASWLVASGAAPPGTDGIPPRTSAAPRRSGRVLVLCPATLRVNWEREIHAVFPQHLVGIVGEDRQSMLHGCQWVVANYEKLGGLVRETALAFDVMVVDEAHYLKEHDSGRTRNAFLMAARIPRRYVVTGTPLLNREIELHTLLRLSGHRLGALPLAEFRKDFSGGRTQRAALAQALKGWMLRRRKDVLTDLGSKSRQVRYVSPAQGIATYKALYEDMSLPAMPKIVKLRQALEALKLQFLVEAIECRSVGDKFIVFCEFMATVGALKEALQAIGVRCVSLVGSDSAQARQRSIDAFQGDASVEVFIGTTSAAGVGITLTAANVVMFASLPWTPALMRQAEDRAYRLGQKRDVLVLVPLVPGTIDEPIWELLASKTALEQDVVEAVRTEVADPKATAGKPAGGQGEEAAPGWAKALLSRVGASPAAMGQGHGTENRSTVA